MAVHDLTRRRLLHGSLVLTGAGLLSGCVTGSSRGGNGNDEGSGVLTLQCHLTDPAPRAVLCTGIDHYNGHQVQINSIATETFRVQLPTYLNSENRLSRRAHLACRLDSPRLRRQRCASRRRDVETSTPAPAG